jgi:hypothetical protein
MQVLKNINNISDKLKEECIPEFKSDEVKTFRMLNGVLNNDPDITERMKTPVFYPNTQIRTWARIKDPFMNEGKGGFVDIGVVETFDLATERPTKYRCVVKGQNVGQFTLRGDVVEDVELYEFLCLSNENEGYKYRDAKVTPLFEEVKQVDPLEESSSEFDLLLDAGAALRKLKIDQKRELSVILHIDPFA